MNQTKIALILSIATIAISAGIVGVKLIGDGKYEDRSSEKYEYKILEKQEMIKALVIMMKRQYQMHGQEYIDSINNSHTTPKYYPFAVSYPDLIITAHSRDTSLVGIPSTRIPNANIPVETNLR